MNNFVVAPLTWVDVARQLSIATRPNEAGLAALERIRVSYFGITFFSTKTLETNLVAAWLSGLFPGRISAAPLSINLDGPAFSSNVPIEIEVIESETYYRPAFGIVDGSIDIKRPVYAGAPNRVVPVVPVLSIKGGTGRTTTASAIALRWTKVTGRPVLLVDADLEAPGISYLLEASLSEAKISLEDLVILAHSESSEQAVETVRFVSNKLKEQRVLGDLYVLPLRRSLDELASSAVRPEHLSTPKNPFALADLLSKVASKLECGGVVADVRAGLMPIGVNLALDPDTFPVFVTTLSDQAIRATRAFVSFINRELRRSGHVPRKPLVVVNRVPSLFQQTGMDRKLIEPLLTDLTDALLQETRPIGADESVFAQTGALDPFSLVVVPELPDLQVSLANWDGYVGQIESSGFSARIADTISTWLSNDVQKANYPDPARKRVRPAVDSIDTRRQALAQFSENLIAAENIKGRVSKPLVTHPLAALASRFQADVPIAVIEGAKGTGKTLAARYLIDQRTWTKAVLELSGNAGASSGLIVPVCASIQVSEQYLSQSDEARRRTAEDLGLDKPLTSVQTTQLLRGRRSIIESEDQWTKYWLDVTAWSCGFRVDQQDAGALFPEFLRSKRAGVIAVFEGLEELYDSSEDTGVPSMMRALLVALPQKLRSELRRPLGALIFARRDTVEASVTQNLDQFRREYSPFSLTWTEDDVLELAAWLATQANSLPGLWTTDFAKLPNQAKSAQLAALWGTKLGSDDTPERRSREAFTHTWIIAVLSDLRGRLVPRDLIRLIASASKLSVDDQEKSSFRNRILLPRALKSAVEPTSLAKVRETEEEIKELHPIFQKFREKAEQVSAPLDRQSLETLGLQTAELDALERHGIVFGEKAPYEVPELFRRGLGLRHSGARYSVVNLYKRARQKAQ